MHKSHSERYSRQVLFAGIGEEGQRRLLNSRIGIIGCGALGSAQAESLARAGAANCASSIETLSNSRISSGRRCLLKVTLLSGCQSDRRR